jgi:hypothetical protein
VLSKSINIVTFDVPYPPDYGGIIDVFYKILCLHKAGIKIHLHCFTYGRKPSSELDSLCEKVYYYPRKTGISSNLSYLPYNVRSRQSKEMENNLLSNNFPILFEVLHTCYLLEDDRFKNRVKIFRHSNIEHVYYNHLARSEKNLLKRAYLKVEAAKLERFEKIVNHANYILAVNEEDSTYFTEKYKNPKTYFVPSFHPHSSIKISKAKGDYILYHGNLSVSENYEAANWLIEHVFSKIQHKVIIAGLKPPVFLRNKIDLFKNILLVADPSENKMNELINNAQVHALYTSQPTGLKLKLLNVLFQGKFVVCNSNMLRGTRFSVNATAGVFTCENGNDFITGIEELMDRAVEETLIAERKKLVEFYSNEKNLQTITDLL